MPVKVRTIVVAVAVVMSAVGLPQAAAASPAGGSRPGMATFQGRVIDLSKGWQGAQSCLVYAALDTRCFATRAEAEVALGYTRERDPLYQSTWGSAGPLGVLAAPSCPGGWLCLYEHTNGEGRALQFRDEYWQYLSNWNFAGRTSSWRNAQAGGDTGYLAMYNRSTAYVCTAGSYANSMGSLNDQAFMVNG
ncbi:peptidase inhibitor family I36 protein [Phytohabitans houttuyneae]|uniref:Peptidase inhibitor family I36 n=1 Tax=Phytohabitans houttuyneae TaxID=1076126 RepID=A0A6V8K162_9ACTN|nr:peptidase inhibitor family I36 protein [Phytohabitans houttuyneae]GFJ77424.1 hypothetical protein Phou_016040 [Phytohabitans houttuyneae]